MKLRSISIGLLLCGALSAWADEAPVGYVKTLTGSATITTGKNKVTAQLGTPCFRAASSRPVPRAAWA